MFSYIIVAFRFFGFYCGSAFQDDQYQNVQNNNETGYNFEENCNKE